MIFEVGFMFLDTVETIKDGVGFSLFGKTHLIWLATFVILAVAVSIIYRKLSSKARNIMRIAVEMGAPFYRRHIPAQLPTSAFVQYKRIFGCIPHIQATKSCRQLLVCNLYSRRHYSTAYTIVDNVACRQFYAYT